MLLTKFTHACVRLEQDDRRLLVDPGIWTEEAAFEGVDAILVTHEHADHLDATRLAEVLRGQRPPQIVGSTAVVNAVATAAGRAVGAAPGLVEVGPEDRRDIAGFEVQVVGGPHAEVYGGLPSVDNRGYLVDGSVYHPGDALRGPRVAVETLLLPTAGPWLKLSEALDFLRATAPRRAISVHDALMSVRGAGVTDRWFLEQGGCDYRRLEPAEALAL